MEQESKIEINKKNLVVKGIEHDEQESNEETTRKISQLNMYTPTEEKDIEETEKF